jgi:DNA (cytosine-5)-methyltransferase 1
MTELDLKQYENVDLYCGGMPCQSFSQAGKRMGFDDARGDLLLYFIRSLPIVKPKVFFFENVRGLLTHNRGETFKKILDEINKLDMYDVSYKLVNAVNYHVPQKRERVIVVGVRKEYKHKFVFPDEEKDKLCLRDVLTDVPKSPSTKYTEKKIELFKLIPPGGCWVDLPEDKQQEYLGKSFTSGGGKRGILRRLDMDEPCLTLLCSPSMKQTERCHPIETRPLTVREYARIQTFPDTYTFSGGVASQYKQIGNAVPVELTYRIGCSISDFIECIGIFNLNTRTQDPTNKLFH